MGEYGKGEGTGRVAGCECTPTPGSPDDYQNKEDTDWAIWMNVKRKDLGKLAQFGNDWREKWGRKIRMGTD